MDREQKQDFAICNVLLLHFLELYTTVIDHLLRCDAQLIQVFINRIFRHIQLFR